MTNSTPDLPLWKLMAQAYDRSCAPPGTTWEDWNGYAEELRAVAKYLFEHRQGAAATLLLEEADKADRTTDSKVSQNHRPDPVERMAEIALIKTLEQIAAIDADKTTDNKAAP